MNRRAALAVLMLIAACSKPKSVNVTEAGLRYEFACTPKRADQTAGGMEFHRMECFTMTGTGGTVMWWDLLEGTTDAPDVILERATRNLSKQFTATPKLKPTQLGSWQGSEFEGPTLEKFGSRFVNGRFFLDAQAKRMRGVIAVEDTAEEAATRNATLHILSAD